MDHLTLKKFDEKDADRFSTVSSIKSKGTRAYVGFDSEELKQTSLSDLKQLKMTIYYYLKSGNQRFKNSEYVHLFKRIIDELKSRSSVTKEIVPEKEVEEEKTKFLGKKKNFKESVYEVLIPSFLNDKQTEYKKEIKKSKKDFDSSAESDSSRHCKNKSLNEIINKKCIIKGKVVH